jgi:hypothetical protein
LSIAIQHLSERVARIIDDQLESTKMGAKRPGNHSIPPCLGPTDRVDTMWHSLAGNLYIEGELRGETRELKFNLATFAQKYFISST